MNYFNIIQIILLLFLSVFVYKPGIIQYLNPLLDDNVVFYKFIFLLILLIFLIKFINKKIKDKNNLSGFSISIIKLTILIIFGIDSLQNPMHQDSMGIMQIFGIILLFISLIYLIFLIIKLIIIKSKKDYILFSTGIFIVLMNLGLNYSILHNMIYIQHDNIKIYGVYFEPGTFNVGFPKIINQADYGGKIETYYEMFGNNYKSDYKGDKLTRFYEKNYKEIEPYSKYATDGKNIYLWTGVLSGYKLISQLDIKTFKAIDCGNNYSCGIDKNYIVINTQIIEGGDPKTFEVIEEGISKDKNRTYYTDYRNFIEGYAKTTW